MYREPVDAIEAFVGKIDPAHVGGGLVCGDDLVRVVEALHANVVDFLPHRADVESIEGDVA